MKKGEFNFLGKILLLLVLISWLSVTNTHAEALLVQAWKTGDENIIYSSGVLTGIDAYLALSDIEIAQIAKPMSRWIPIMDALQACPDQSWKTCKTSTDWTTFVNNQPFTGETRRRLGLAGFAAEKLRYLAEKGRIHDQSVIPDLIAGLDEPGFGLTQNCFYALTSLTRLYGHLPHGLPQEQKIPKLKDWYQAWWLANHSKNLIVDYTLREQMKDSVLGICVRIKKATDQAGNSFHGYKVPTRKDLIMGGESGGLFETSYFPNSELSGIDAGRAGLAPWIWIGIVSQSHVLILSEIPPFTVESTFPKTAKEIYRAPIENSDWQIEVYTNKTSPQDDAAIVKSLWGN